MSKICPRNYMMPPEWSRHAATMLTWPHNRQTWPGDRLSKVEQVYLELIKSIVPREPILLFVNDKSIKERVVNYFDQQNIDTADIEVVTQPVNDVWVRDCGPITVKHQRKETYAIVNWVYNAWGEKYPPWRDDNQLPEFIANKYGLPSFEPGIVLEGGAIDTNGTGVFLTTESVLLNKNRNPDLTKKKVEEYLSIYLGAEKVIWLKNGLTGDDTDGHIDGLARFVNANTIVTAICENKNDLNYDALKENYKLLKSATDENGKRFTIIPIPLPETKIEGETVDGSEHVPASYINFYILNDAVLLPLYDDRYDRSVVEIFSELFPKRRIIGIPCSDLVWGQGSIHCITQQLYGIDITVNKTTS